MRLVVVIGARMQINAAVRAGGGEPRYAHGYRVTDPASLQAAIQAAGHARMEIESRLSKVSAGVEWSGGWGVVRLAGWGRLAPCSLCLYQREAGAPYLSHPPPSAPAQGPAVTMVRRHARGGDGSQQSYGPALQTVSGNYVAAKRKGVVGGVDYQLTGVVRFVQVRARGGGWNGGPARRHGAACGRAARHPAGGPQRRPARPALPCPVSPAPLQTDAVKRQLASGCVVLLSNLGFSAAGEVLNCDIYTGGWQGGGRRRVVGRVGLMAGVHSAVSPPSLPRPPACHLPPAAVAARAAIDLGADKLIVLTTPDSQPLALPLWLPLSDAESMLRGMVPADTRALDDDLARGGCGACGDGGSRQGDGVT